MSRYIRTRVEKIESSSITIDYVNGTGEKRSAFASYEGKPANFPVNMDNMQYFCRGTKTESVIFTKTPTDLQTHPTVSFPQILFMPNTADGYPIRWWYAPNEQGMKHREADYHYICSNFSVTIPIRVNRG